MIKLTPKVDALVRDFVDNKALIRTLTNGFGTPLNIIFPEILSKNIKSFQDIFKKYNLDGKIYYAHKANKSLSLVKQAKSENIFIDVASAKELHDALNSGFSGDEIEVTGPKSSELLILALQHQCIIQIDNMSELKQIVNFFNKLHPKNPVSILIRFSGFSSQDTKVISKDSRFGIGLSEQKNVIDFLTFHKDIFNFKGFSFHLDSNTPKEKSIALENLIQLYETFQNNGLTSTFVNIGGGFKINYIAEEKEWNSFIDALQQAALGTISPITWHNANFGFYNEENRVRGNSNFYEYFTKTAGAEYLDEILSVKLPSQDNTIAAQMISDLMLKLVIEPGRSLLDQVGITVAKVNFVKKSPQGEWLVGLDMNRSNLASTDQEMMLDPIIVYKREDINEKEFGVYFVGNLCLESDFIYKHKTFIKRLPEDGDLVIFINTAAYNMDFTESATIQQKIAKKIVVIKRDNHFHWFEDSQYNPYLLDEQI